MANALKHIEYIGESRSIAQLPAAERAEYAFTGRSNVGKSSLINMLTDKKNLAYASQKPGKTQAIYHYLAENSWFFVDLPGYGYAKATKKDRLGFSKLIKDYVLKRENLVCLFVLIDVRHFPQRNDLEFMRWTYAKGIPIAIVFTKADKLSQDKLERNVSIYKKEMLKEWEYLPEFFITSSVNKQGKEEILSYISGINQTLPELQPNLC
jgi:GTP-binding protein